MTKPLHPVPSALQPMVMHSLRVLACAGGALWLAACSPSSLPEHHANAFPMGEIDRFDQPKPTALMFNQPVLKTHDVLPVAKADIREPLPPQAALPAAKDIEAAPANTGNPEDGGAVNPAAGQAAAISDGQGEGGKHELGVSK